MGPPTKGFHSIPAAGFVLFSKIACIGIIGPLHGQPQQMILVPSGTPTLRTVFMIKSDLTRPSRAAVCRN